MYKLIKTIELTTPQAVHSPALLRAALAEIDPYLELTPWEFSEIFCNKRLRKDRYCITSCREHIQVWIEKYPHINHS